jgi:homoserine acetyltransferase
MDLEDDTHMETTVTNDNIIVAKITLTDEVIDTIVKRVTDRMDIQQMIDDQIEYFMQNYFDINDYTNNLDTYDIKRGIVDDVIETIKERL